MNKLQCVALCSVGKERKNNQDNLYLNGTYKGKNEATFFEQDIQDVAGEYIYAVTDGMGGLCYGEEAAYAAVSELKRYVAEKRNKNKPTSGRKAIQYMNQAVCILGREKKAPVGSTVTILKYQNRNVCVYNVGDSKAFLLRNGSMNQLSEDHTERESFLRMKEEMGITDFVFSGNGLTQYLGVEEDEFLLEPGVTENIEMEEQDIFLLCSDGLTGMVDTEDIRQVILETTGLEAKAKKLERMAMDAGGKDNITILLLSLCEIR